MGIATPTMRTGVELLVDQRNPAPYIAKSAAALSSFLKRLLQILWSTSAPLERWAGSSYALLGGGVRLTRTMSAAAVPMLDWSRSLATSR